MKSALQAGVVAALLCPTSVIAGPPAQSGQKAPTCLKPPAYGSKRVTCILEVDHTRVRGEKGHHGDNGNNGNKKHKNDEYDIIRTTNVYAWSFIWNYFIKDGCPRTEGHLRPILPMLGRTHHTINCRVEARWSPDVHAHGAGNYSVDYAGHGLVDWKSVPARMEWPFLAHSGRPEHSANEQQSQYLNIKYQLAEPIALSTFEVHSGKGNDFSHCWGQQGEGIHLPSGGYGGGQDNHGSDSDSDDENGGGSSSKNGSGKSGNGKDKKDEKDKKKDQEGPRTSVKRMHNRFGGHYNTKKLHSCWVFEKYHLGVRQVISERKDKDKHGDDDSNKNNNRFNTYNWFDMFNGDDGNGNKGNDGYSAGNTGSIGFNGNKGIGGLAGNQLNHTLAGYPFFPQMWSTCEPQFMLPEPCHEHECHGDSCGSKRGSSEHDCHDDSCDSERAGSQQGGSKQGGSKQGGSKQGGSKQGGSKQGGSKQGGSKQGGSKQGGSQQGGRGQKQEVGNRCDGQACNRADQHGCDEQSCSDNESDHECEHDCGDNHGQDHRDDGSDGEDHSDDGSDNDCHGCDGGHGDDGSDNECEHGCGGDGHGEKGHRDGCNC